MKSLNYIIFKSIIPFIEVLLAYCSVCITYADENSFSVDKISVFKNDIAIPKTLYMLENTPNDMFIRPIIKRYRPYNDYVTFKLDTGSFLRRLSNVATISNPIDNSTLTVSLINSDEFQTIKEEKVLIHVGKKYCGDREVTAQIIGDSYTNGAFYKDALIEKKYCPKLKLVGLRKRRDGYYDEGRGGWSLASYFQIPTKPDQSYHAFMQPDGDFRYWGSTGFWINAHLCAKNKQPSGFEPTYSCSRFDDYISFFDEKTGLLMNPQKNDIQYDNSQNCFITFDGNQWNKTSNKLKWHFDYSKYLLMFKIQAPDFIFIQLGLNDFRYKATPDFDTWKKRIIEVYSSVKEANPHVFFVICIPCTTCGSLDNESGVFTPKLDANMWNFRQWLIENFDGKENLSIFLLDTGICIDADNGYPLSSQKDIISFGKIDDPVTIEVQKGNPHPYLSYPAIGIQLAAFIQYHRKSLETE